MKILFVVNEPWFFLSHRLSIAKTVHEMGYEVHVATSDGPAVNNILSYGFVHHKLPITRSGQKLLVELKFLFYIHKLYSRVNPDIVHLVTIKPVLYGGIAARFSKVPSVVAAVSGLGFVSVAPGIKGYMTRLLVKWLYWIALGKKNLKVIFQNPDDRNTLLKHNLVSIDKTIIIPGSGVDLLEYKVQEEPKDTPVVIMAARLIREKGVYEFVDAAKMLQDRGVNVRFVLAGDLDLGNPGSISAAQLNKWKTNQYIDYLGHRNDMADLLARSNIVVLPSYYGEGLPKVLIEAASCARAVVTTDHPGCRDAIIPGVSGLLVPVRDVNALANAIEKLLLNEKLRGDMGKAGRKLAEEKYDIKRVIDTHVEIYRGMESRI